MLSRRSHPQGFTLIELLLAIALLGVGIVGLVSAMGDLTVVSSYNRDQGDALDQLHSYATSVQAAAYVPCATSSSYSFTPQAGFTATSSVDFYTFASSTFSSTPPASCPTSDTGLQRITITLTATDGRAVETMKVAKRP